jgi:broad specificity polyphosphatase/5'/3'-nucleotidase SurE
MQIREGYVTITPLNMDMTNYEMLARMQTLEVGA